MNSELQDYFSQKLEIERRRFFSDLHGDLEQRGLDCAGCVGTCCTFEANSMKIGPLQAIEILVDLLSRGISVEEVRKSCEETVERYRLDYEISTSRSSLSLRRTYTCPFYRPEVYGCRVSRTHRPLGCLAFNPKVGGQTSGGALIPQRAESDCGRLYCCDRPFP